MSIFEQYGIKEVADVTLYAIELDENDEEIYIPVLYLDTLKISSVEESASSVSAKGGLANPALITWDFGKEITVNLEDALYTPASMSLLWGGKYGSKTVELWGVFDVKDGGFSWAKAIVKDFSDFSQHQDETKGMVYFWKVNLIIISLDGKYRYEKQNVGVSYYSIHGRNYWSFDESVNFNDGSFTLSEGKNLLISVPQELIYQIDSGIEDAKIIERTEKCVATRDFVIDIDNNTKHGNYRYLNKYNNKDLTVFINPNTMLPYEGNLKYFIKKDGTRYPKQGFKDLQLIKQGEIYYKWTRTIAKQHKSLGKRIIVDAEHFSGVYRLVGETYSRNRETFEDERFQFEIPLCKIKTENKLTLEAAGEPTVFNMKLQVLRKEDGTMMKLTQYTVEKVKYDNHFSGSTIITQSDSPEKMFDNISIKEEWKNPYELNWGIDEYGDKVEMISFEITNPTNDDEFYIDNEIFWATSEDRETLLPEEAITIDGIVGTVRTDLLVQTVDDVIQWENSTPVFVLDDDGNIQTRTYELEKRNVQFTSDNLDGKDILLSLKQNEEGGE